MKKKEPGFWPFTSRNSIILTFVLLIVLMGILGLLQIKAKWPADGSTNTLLIGIFILSLLPVILAVLNVVIERGGTIGYGDFKVDFAQAQRSGHAGITIPANIGMPGVSVTDSATSNILHVLRQAASSGIIVIDLEDGHAWWETRLLVLLSGAARLNKPDKIVFVGTHGGQQQKYLGWGRPADLLQQLLEQNIQYKQSYYFARATARQFELIAPTVPPTNFAPIWMTPVDYSTYGWMMTSPVDGSPNELLMEQLLQDNLGQLVENLGQTKEVSITRLDEIFKLVLIKANIDKNWPDEKQTEALFTGDAPYIAITENGRYEGLVSRQLVVNEMLRNVLDIGVKDKAK